MVLLFFSYRNLKSTQLFELRVDGIGGEKLQFAFFDRILRPYSLVFTAPIYRQSHIQPELDLHASVVSKIQ